MSALREIAAIYRASKKKRDINWWTEWVCRPPAAALVYALRHTRVTPNQLTFTSLAVCALAGAMLLAGSGWLWVLAAMLVFEISFVLDCADGQLARLRKRASVLGHLLDFLMDELKAMLLYGCVAVHLWRFSDEPYYLLIGVGGMFCLASGIALTSFMRRPEYGAPPPTEDGQPAIIQRRAGAVGLAVTLLEHAARVVVHYPSYILILAALGRIDIYFWAYTAVNLAYMGRCLAVIGLRLGRFEPGVERGSGSESAGPAQPPGDEPS
ncbi:CDP-alcohol phosphatidyltransferase family protein [Haliangium sp.]|uniref:CDP-alcohol phosphatidyltransferase family protein n=1 Tax=Haliangium sp. TaxID=2663208 RepID=UPI003D0DADC1